MINTKSNTENIFNDFPLLKSLLDAGLFKGDRKKIATGLSMMSCEQRHRLAFASPNVVVEEALATLEEQNVLNDFPLLNSLFDAGHFEGNRKKIAAGLSMMSCEQRYRLAFASPNTLVEEALATLEEQNIFNDFPLLKSLFDSGLFEGDRKKIAAGLSMMSCEQRHQLAFASPNMLAKEALATLEEQNIFKDFPLLKSLLDAGLLKGDRKKIAAGLSLMSYEERLRLAFASPDSVIKQAIENYTDISECPHISVILPNSILESYKKERDKEIDQLIDSATRFRTNIQDKANSLDLEKAKKEFVKPFSERQPNKPYFLGVELHEAIEDRDESRAKEIIKDDAFCLEVLFTMHRAAKMSVQEMANFKEEVRKIDGRNRSVIAMAEENRIFSDQVEAKIKESFDAMKNLNPSLSEDAIFGRLSIQYKVHAKKGKCSKAKIRRIVKPNLFS